MFKVKEEFYTPYVMTLLVFPICLKPHVCVMIILKIVPFAGFFCHLIARDEQLST